MFVHSLPPPLALAQLHDSTKDHDNITKALRSKLQAATGDLEDASAERSQLASQVSALQRELKAAESGRMTLEEEVQRLHHQLAQVTRDRDSLLEQLDDARSELEQLQASSAPLRCVVCCVWLCVCRSTQLPVVHVR